MDLYIKSSCQVIFFVFLWNMKLFNPLFFFFFPPLPWPFLPSCSRWFMLLAPSRQHCYRNKKSHNTAKNNHHGSNDNNSALQSRINPSRNEIKLRTMAETDGKVYNGRKRRNWGIIRKTLNIWAVWCYCCCCLDTVCCLRKLGSNEGCVYRNHPLSPLRRWEPTLTAEGLTL